MPIFVDPHLSRLVSRVQRRMIFTKRLEYVARCAGPACVIAVVFATIALWMNRPSLAMTGVILTAGAVIGVAWAWIVKFSESRCAEWIDQRLNLQDLLATAWTVRDSNQPWERAIVAMAETRCREITPASALPPLAGGRTWSAIALAAALALSLGMISPMSGQTAAIVSADGTTLAQPPSLSNPLASGAVNSRPAGDTALNEPSHRTSADASSIADQQSSKADSSGDGSTAGGRPGMAAGLSRTDAKIPSNSAPLQADGNSPASLRGTIASGGTGTSQGGQPSAALAGPGNSSPAEITPPWQAPSWPAARSAAMQSVQSGAVDPAYQSIVRDYFSRP